MTILFLRDNRLYFPVTSTVSAAHKGKDETVDMTIDILTIFPEMFESVLNTSILGRARKGRLVEIETTDIRPFSASKHKNTDDYPFGGGAGMLMMAQPIADAMKAVCEKRGLPCHDNMLSNTKIDQSLADDVGYMDIEHGMFCARPFCTPAAGNVFSPCQASQPASDVLCSSAQDQAENRLGSGEISASMSASGQSAESTGVMPDAHATDLFRSVAGESPSNAIRQGEADAPLLNAAGAAEPQPPQRENHFGAASTGNVASLQTVKRIFMSPRGVPLTQKLAQSLAAEEHLIILCGHYEGVDQRVLDKYIDLEISVGDYVLTGGEVAAMALVDCVSRLIPGVLGSAESPRDESFSAEDGMLEYPQYTRPRVFEGLAVPDVLLGGDHAKIAAWRRAQSLLVTQARRPDLLVKRGKDDASVKP